MRKVSGLIAGLLCLTQIISFAPKKANAGSALDGAGLDCASTLCARESSPISPLCITIKEGTYKIRVAKGYTLTHIANLLSYLDGSIISIEDILRHNPRIKDPNHIEIGWELQYWRDQYNDRTPGIEIRDNSTAL